MPQQARPAAGGGGPSPFAAAAAPAAAAERKVTLVIDDSAVKEDEIGRKSGMRNVVLVVIGCALGLAIGLGFASVNSENRLWNMAVADGRDIYNKVNETSKALEQADGHLKKLIASTSGGAGKVAHIDYSAVEALVAMERPFGASEFSRRRYRAFPTPVVDDLFTYYNGINQLWDKFSLLGAKTAGQNKREALDKSAKAADDLMSSQYGMVVTKSGDVMTGGMVLVRPKPQDEGEKPEEGAAPVFLVSSREGGREVERSLFTGQTDFAENYGNYVLMIDKGRSMGTLGLSANLFGDLRGEITATQGLMKNTLEAQGRLLQELGKVAALPERLAL